MDTKLESRTGTGTQQLSLKELELKHKDFILKCAFSKAVANKKLESARNLKDQNQICIDIIKEVNEQIRVNQDRLKKIELCGEEGEELYGRVSREIDRQNKYIDDLKLQQSENQSLEHLFSLSTEELKEEAIKNKSSARMILKTPELINKISDNQLSLMTHQDSGLLQLITPILIERDYTQETMQIFDSLKQKLQSPSDIQHIEQQQNAAIRILLLKMKAYLDEKIENAAKENSSPWTLGYFGSHYKINKNKMSVSVPLGIYEIKTELDQIDKKSPKELLNNIQMKLRSKLEETKDESFSRQFSRWMSYLFGYYRTQETINEYQNLEKISLGM